VKVDGNDAEAVYVAVKAAVDKARSGGGPTLVECETYRIGAHSSSDDPTRYRDEREVETWRKRDPIERMRARLISAGLWSEQKDEELRTRVTADVNAAIAEAEAKPDPARESLFDDVYSTLPWFLREEREQMLAAPAGPRPGAAPK
jgi:pyruvate dehydrogenase E1 component alpha subunit/2-oxoisovalerate dehydrogenase E1 component alpha subunit